MHARKPLSPRSGIPSAGFRGTWLLFPPVSQSPSPGRCNTDLTSLGHSGTHFGSLHFSMSMLTLLLAAVTVNGRAGVFGVRCSSGWLLCFIISLVEMISQEAVEGVNYASLGIMKKICLQQELYKRGSTNEELCEMRTGLAPTQAAVCPITSKLPVCHSLSFAGRRQAAMFIGCTP